jgi:hypothetical protein|tara:strand:- start:778 stop:966 length:189 start_codon:yes stop_codon:yes gene_type:complete
MVMAVYINKEGRRVLSLTDEEFSDLQWDEIILLELEHDGVGWTIQQASCNTAKAIKDEDSPD